MQPAAAWNRNDYLVSLSDTGDGWFHSPSPIICEIIDEGPGPLVSQGLYGLLLRTTAAPFSWHGSSAMLRRWGPDHPLADALPDSTCALACVDPLPPEPFSLCPLYVSYDVVTRVSELTADLVWPGWKLAGTYLRIDSPDTGT